MLEILPLVVGPVATNAYLIADTNTGEATVIDPAWDGQGIIAAGAIARLAHRANLDHARSFRPFRRVG